MQRTSTNTHPSVKQGYFTCLTAHLFLVVSLSSPMLQGAEAPPPPAHNSSSAHWESYREPPHASQQGRDLSSQIGIEEIVEASQDYTYASFDKPNPFAPPPLSTYLSKLEVPIVSILQRYPLASLQAVGIWLLENQERKALIMTPKGEGVIVGLGDLIGNRGGKVAAILADRVRARQFTLTPEGNRHFDDTDIWLGNEEPKKQEKIVIGSRRATPSQGKSRGQGYLETMPNQKNRLEDFAQKAAASLRETSQLQESAAPTPSVPVRPFTDKAPNDKGEHHEVDSTHPSTESL